MPAYFLCRNKKRFFEGDVKKLRFYIYLVYDNSVSAFEQRYRVRAVPGTIYMCCTTACSCAAVSQVCHQNRKNEYPYTPQSTVLRGYYIYSEYREYSAQ